MDDMKLALGSIGVTVVAERTKAERVKSPGAYGTE